MNTKRRCDRAFKERAVKLSYWRNSITELASELGILPDRIYSWHKEFADYGSASFSGHGIESLSDECRRVKEFYKKLKTYSSLVKNCVMLWIRKWCKVCPEEATAGITPWQRASLRASNAS